MDCLDNKERIEFIRLCAKSKKIDLLENNLDILFENNNDEVNYAYIIKKLLELDIDNNKILLEISKNIDNIIKNNPVKMFWDENLIKSISYLFLDNTFDSKELLRIKIIIFNSYIRNYKKILKLDNYSFNSIKMLLSIGLPDNMIFDIKDEIRDNMCGEDLLEFDRLLKKNNQSFDMDITCDEILLKMFNQVGMKYYQDHVTDLSNELNLLINEEGINISDIKSLGEGSYNKVLKVGSKVVKIGGVREVSDIPEHSLILNDSKPIKYFDNVCFEVQDYINCNWYINLFEDEIKEKEYEVFKQLKDDGIYWADIRKENLGMNSDGNLVVVDRDFLYTDPKFTHNPNKYIEFLERYNREKRTKVRK